MQRDDRGRFMKGNSMAGGNKGNTLPKYGNKNAVRHGLYSTFQVVTKLTTTDEYLYIYLSRSNMIKIATSHFFIDEQGRIRIHEAVATDLERLGIELEE
ncbi:hypothetical protein SAMN04488134_102136 [Amphibacillus marinus]|uniref:Uncharacterized protein n=1 Tax=Amphibacillus marinus TaxID=872970 RepID=A0A1H8K115_9BACI|nr:hypothetical protein [Amphibacillus marinus]SEN86719.1 hypothetical protein SAMN04488134_102136 [Amphibacillus marinus]